MTTFKRGLVALSADPITYGHLDIIKRAKDQCDEVIVAVMDNPQKRHSYTLSLGERRLIAKKAVMQQALDGVQVIGSSGLLLDVYLRESCDAIFRGVRNAKDRDYEEEQAEVNVHFLPQLAGRFHYIESRPDLKHVSSTLVKEAVRNGLDADKLVPMFVKQLLEEKILGQYRIGITGCISVGKSSVAQALTAEAAQAGLQATHLNVDDFLRQLYDENTRAAMDIRLALMERFGAEVASHLGLKVDRKALAAKIFDKQTSDADRQFVVDLTLPHVHRLFRQEIVGLKGLVVVEWAQMAEMDMGAWTNNNVILVDSPDRQKFIEARGLDPVRVRHMARLQLSAEDKLKRLGAAAIAAQSGEVLLHENRFRADGKPPLPTGLLPEVRRLFPTLK